VRRRSVRSPPPLGCSTKTMCTRFHSECDESKAKEEDKGDINELEDLRGVAFGSDVHATGSGARQLPSRGRGQPPGPCQCPAQWTGGPGLEWCHCGGDSGGKAAAQRKQRSQPAQEPGPDGGPLRLTTGMGPTVTVVTGEGLCAMPAACVLKPASATRVVLHVPCKCMYVYKQSEYARSDRERPMLTSASACGHDCNVVSHPSSQ